MAQQKILITGAGGQIGAVLTLALRDLHGSAHVLATDLRKLEDTSGPTAVLDALDREALSGLVEANRITQIYHLAAILSATGERDPLWAWNINMGSLFNVLEVARAFGVERVYYPSSIAVFGEEAIQSLTPQHSVLIPSTVYGISKVAGEHWGNYYFHRYGLDVRSLRYPGIIGHQTLPGGGTTDYAVDIYHYALRGETFTCFLGPDTRLPMCYMDDAIRATLEVMEAPAASIRVRTGYNLSGMSFTPAEIASSIQRELPDFSIRYAPDFRQAIADSWPGSIDDTAARTDWGWCPRFDLDAMTKDMFVHLRRKQVQNP
jgi:nucleoside-diphosphate-sugar epimerase